MRPNHLTVLRAAVGLAACTLLATGVPDLVRASGFLWLVACILDRADGELARVGDMRSETGKVLDYYSDLGLDSLWFLAAGLSLRGGSYGTLAVVLGAATAVSVFACICYAEMWERLQTSGAKAIGGAGPFHPDDSLFLLAPFVWLGWLLPLLALACLSSATLAVVLTTRYLLVRSRQKRSHVNQLEGRASRHHI